MLSRLYSPSKNEDAFTLIELLIVVIIIGILAAIALPIFLNQQKAAADASVQSDVRNTVTSVQSWQTTPSNQNKAEASTYNYVSAGGKAVVSSRDTVGVAVASDGSYTVCGYSSGGQQFKSTTAAYVYDSKTGNFGSGSCTTGADNGGTYGSVGVATSITSGGETGDPTLANWNVAPSTSCAHSGSKGFCVDAATVPYNGYTTGGITFNAPTTAGTKYTMTVWMEEYQGDTSYDCLTANAAGQSQSVCMVYQSSGPGGSGFYSSGWVQKTLTFTATSSSTPITFNTTTSQYYQGRGAVDDVVLTAN